MQLMHLQGSARGDAEIAAFAQDCEAGVVSSPRRRCCPKEGDETASRDRTPPKQRGSLGEREPPAAPGLWRKKPPLLKAIESGSIAQVRAVMELSSGDVGIMSLAFDDFEPALCCAVRTGQSEDMVRTLLRYGADTNESKMGGQSALCHLCDSQSCRGDSEESMGMIAPALGGLWMSPSFHFNGISMSLPKVALSLSPSAEAWQLRVGTLLLAAGADSNACVSSGASPAMLAQKSGKRRLACLVEYYGIAQVMFIIGRILRTGPARHRAVPPVGMITEGILRMICGFLAPEGSEIMLLRIGALLRR